MEYLILSLALFFPLMIKYLGDLLGLIEKKLPEERRVKGNNQSHRIAGM